MTHYSINVATPEVKKILLTTGDGVVIGTIQIWPSRNGVATISLVQKEGNGRITDICATANGKQDSELINTYPEGIWHIEANLESVRK